MNFSVAGCRGFSVEWNQTKIKSAESQIPHTWRHQATVKLVDGTCDDWFLDQQLAVGTQIHSSESQHLKIDVLLFFFLGARSHACAHLLVVNATARTIRLSELAVAVTCAVPRDRWAQ